MKRRNFKFQIANFKLAIEMQIQERSGTFDNLQFEICNLKFEIPFSPHLPL